jgi:glycosyltransferase involved in cell wall biosynthesis
MASSVIALLHFSAPPVVGGVESVLGRHAALMADAGHHVRIVAGRGGSTDPRVAFVRLRLADSRRPRIQAARAELDGGRVPDGFDSLVDEATRDLAAATADADVVIAHNVASLPVNLALTAALHDLSLRSDGPAIVLWHHDVAAVMDGYLDRLHPGWPWDLVRTTWSGTTSVAISAARADAYAQTTGLPVDQIRIIPDGIDLAESLGLHPTTARFLADRGIGHASPILLAPVRLTPRKNLELAVEVLAVMRRTRPDACLVVTGALDPHDPAARSYLDRIRRLAREGGVDDRLHVLAEWLGGPPPRRLVTDLLRMADALLLTSRDEGFGLPLLESAIHRLPAFCPAIDALREIAGPDACLFPIDAPADAVAGLVSDRLSTDAAHRAAVRTRREYAWSAIYDRSIGPLIASLVATS